MFLFFNYYVYALLYFDIFYFVFVWLLVVLFLDSVCSYLLFFYYSFFFYLDRLLCDFLLFDMDSFWEVNGGSKYSFFLYVTAILYLFFLVYQLSALHFGVISDLANVSSFMLPLIFIYVFAFFIEYGLSFCSFFIGNSWLSSWYIFDLFEWLGCYILRIIVKFLGNIIYTSLSGVSIFGLFWPFAYLLIFIISFVYLFYIPIACFVSYIAVFTALSVLWNVWVTLSFSVLTISFGFCYSVVLVASFFFFSVLFLCFEMSYVFIHIILLLMLYMNIVSVVLVHNRFVGSYSSVSLPSYYC